VVAEQEAALVGGEVLLPDNLDVVPPRHEDPKEYPEGKTRERIQQVGETDLRREPLKSQDESDR
jgi:hypothetical protein